MESFNNTPIHKIKIMKLNDYNSLDEISEKELLKFILANQFSILRRLSFIERHMNEDKDKEDVIEFSFDVKRFIDKTDISISGINNHLSKDDLEKGYLKF